MVVGDGSMNLPRAWSQAAQGLADHDNHQAGQTMGTRACNMRRPFDTVEDPEDAVQCLWEAVCLGDGPKHGKISNRRQSSIDWQTLNTKWQVSFCVTLSALSNIPFRGKKKNQCTRNVRCFVAGTNWLAVVIAISLRLVGHETNSGWAPWERPI